MRPHGVRMVLLLALGLGLANPAAAQPDSWDPRLDELGIGIYYAEPLPGEWYWRLVIGEFQNEQEARGTHHVYYRCMDPDGNLIEDQLTWAFWPTANPMNAAWQWTKGPVDGYWANFPMSGGNW